MAPARRSKVAFHVLTVVAVVVCVMAARWQWQRAHRSVADAVPDVPAVQWIAFDPAQSFSGQRVTVTGRYLPEQVLVAPRTRDGRNGAWVYTALVPDAQPAADAQPAGEQVAAIGVIRGWVPDGVPASTLTAQAGEVTVTGILVADERRPGVTASPGPDGIATTKRVDSLALAQLTGRQVRAGWLALVAAEPAVPGQPAALEVGELPGADVGLNWRNAAYAAQWLVFAAFAVFFWNRFRQDYYESGRPEAAEEGTRS